MIENPRTSFLWLLPCIQRLRDLPRTVLITCDMCAFGTRYRKRTGLLVGNCDPQDLLRLQCLCGGGGKKPCSFTRKPHYILEGGVNTRKAAVYPREFAEHCAFVLYSALREGGNN